MQDAWRSMKKIRHTEVQAARDLYYAYILFMEESKVSSGVIVTLPAPADLCCRLSRVRHLYPDSRNFSLSLDVAEPTTLPQP
jgi:hypothetical protein